jgi:hypothetical protein
MLNQHGIDLAWNGSDAYFDRTPFPVAQNSRYTVTLRFCESWFGPSRPAGGGAGRRLFDISFNGCILLGNFDKTFKGLEPNAQGKLVFSFASRRQYAMVNAIEVVDEGWK